MRHATHALGWMLMGVLGGSHSASGNFSFSMSHTPFQCSVWSGGCQEQARKTIEHAMGPHSHSVQCRQDKCSVIMTTHTRRQVLDVLNQLDHTKVGVVELDVIERLDDGTYHVTLLITPTCP